MTELDLVLKGAGRGLKTDLKKKAHRAKTKDKFEIVQLILPRIADKSAKIVNKKIPVLDATITKIMGVVWVDEVITYDKKAKRHTVTLNVHNFTAAGKKLNLHLLLPRGIVPKSIDPKPAEVRDDGKITWELKRIDSVAKASISFVLEGLDEAEYDESDIYVSGINPGLVIGAEPLPGDWELNYAEIEGEEAPAAEPEEEGEVDYDETEEALDDEEEERRGAGTKQGWGRALCNRGRDLRGTRRRPNPKDEAPSAHEGEHPLRLEARGLEVRQPDGRAEREEAQGRPHAPADDVRPRVHPGHDPGQQVLDAEGDVLHLRRLGHREVPRPGGIEPPRGGPRGHHAAPAGGFQTPPGGKRSERHREYHTRRDYPRRRSQANQLPR